MTSKPWNPFADIAAFHEKYGLEYKGQPRLLPDEKPVTVGTSPLPGPNTSMAEFRRKFLLEEAKEYSTATYRGNHSLHLTADPNDRAGEITEHLADALDALVDTLYVALGGAYLHGFTAERFTEAWNRVHHKNMLKVRVERADQSKRGSAFDVVKPKDWTPADLSDLVVDHIHRPAVVPVQKASSGPKMLWPEVGQEFIEKLPPKGTTVPRRFVVSSIDEVKAIIRGTVYDGTGANPYSCAPDVFEKVWLP